MIYTNLVVLDHAPETEARCCSRRDLVSDDCARDSPYMADRIVRGLDMAAGRSAGRFRSLLASTLSSASRHSTLPSKTLRAVFDRKPRRMPKGLASMRMCV